LSDIDHDDRLNDIDTGSATLLGLITALENTITNTVTPAIGLNASDIATLSIRLGITEVKITDLETLTAQHTSDIADIVSDMDSLTIAHSFFADAVDATFNDIEILNNTQTSDITDLKLNFSTSVL
jgi:hypothetical protein